MMGNPVFVTGPPRTGTTVTAWLLNWHPHCAISTFEDHWWLDWVAWQIRPIENVKTPTVQEIIENQLKLHGLPPDGVFGIKSPRWVLYWRMLRAWFPECSFVVTERDRQETARSIVRQGWSETEADAEQALEQHWAALEFVPRLTTVSLEGLKKSPVLTVGELLEALLLDPALYPWKEAMQQLSERIIN
jgi:hypothetical protein